METSPRRRRPISLLIVAAGVLTIVACAFAWWPPARHGTARIYENMERRMSAAPAGQFAAARARLASLTGGAPLPLPDAGLRIDKRSRRATLLAGDRAIKTYKIVLGPHPEGHKQREGDGRTPEGTYHICTRLNQSKFYCFMGLNYPNAGDARHGLDARLITSGQHDGLVDAEQRRNAPSWTTPLGGAIGLHGGGTVRDWTAGCIAFDNDAIEEIWLATDYWTPVTIE